MIIFFHIMCLVLRKKHFTKVWIIFINYKFDVRCMMPFTRFLKFSWILMK